MGASAVRAFSNVFSNEHNRFFGLFGMYFSLQYLSLSDAVVLTFLTPMCTGLAGKLFLKEKYTLLQASAGRASFIPYSSYD